MTPEAVTLAGRCFQAHDVRGSKEMGQVSIGLLGSGEFEPWTEEADRMLLSRVGGGDGRVLILPTASAPEGDAAFDKWADKGLAHYQGLRITAEVAPLKTRADAEEEHLASYLAEASLVFFSGGNPAYLARTLLGTRFWHALEDAVCRGDVALAGCSAGALFLSPRAFDSDRDDLSQDCWQPGMNFFPATYVGPHWDALDTYVPGLRDFFIASVPSGGSLLALDESTAVVGDGLIWTVMGRGRAHTFVNGMHQEFAAGERFALPMLTSDSPGGAVAVYPPQ
jgi:cyanophycinase